MADKERLNKQINKPGLVAVSDLIFLKSLLEIFEKFRLQRISLSYCYEFFCGKFNLSRAEAKRILRRLDQLGFVKITRGYVVKKFHPWIQNEGGENKGDKKE